MALTLSTPNTVLGALAPKSGAAHIATNLATVVAGSLLLWASAKISVPITPVPVSLQSFAIAVLGAAFGWRIAVSTLLLYIAEGLSGLPVFAYGGGIQYLMSPSFGFIVGGLPMAFIIGLAADRSAHQIAVTADIFGQRQQRNVGALFQRLLEDRTQHGVVHHHGRTMAL